MRDPISIERVQQLHPAVRDTFTRFIEECEHMDNITLRIMLPVYRTIAEQDALYAHGRNGDTRPVVTKAKGGESFHNYGLAIDICVVGAHGEMVWSFDNSVLEPIAKKYDIEWGGDWQSIKDRPHFQISFGHTWQQLFNLVQLGHVDAEGYVLLSDPNGDG